MGRVRELLGARRDEEQQGAVTSAECARLRHLFIHSPALIAVFSGERHVFELANPTFQQFVEGQDLIGKAVREVLPHGLWHSYLTKLEEVYQTGQPSVSHEWFLRHAADEDYLEVRCIDFTYQPIRDANELISGVYTHGADVTEHVLRIADKEIALDRLKNVWSPAISHRLLTSLSPIIDWTDLLRNEPRQQEITNQGLRIINQNARDLDEMIRREQDLVDDLLEISSIEGLGLQFDPSPVEIKSIVRDAAAGLIPLAQQRGIDLRLSLPEFEQPTTIMGDNLRLKQVFHNLLQNAIKFSDPGGRVRVGYRTGGELVQIQISDEGRGIAPEVMPHLFNDFDHPEGTKAKSGLGLAITRHLVEMHGGRISAESEGMNRGATFTVELPVSKMEVAAIENSGESREVAMRGTEGADGTPPPEYKRISAWINERVDAPEKPLLVSEAYTLCFRVGTTTASGELLLTEDAVLPESDIPENGLDTTWLVRSNNVELVALVGDNDAKIKKDDTSYACQVSFALHIPKLVPSDVLKLILIPRAAEGARLDITILCAGKHLSSVHHRVERHFRRRARRHGTEGRGADQS